MDRYRLLFFDCSGPADPIRFMFLYRNIKFEDERISFDDWVDLKDKMPFNKLPVLLINNDVMIAQSKSIYRYLGNKHQLNGGFSNDIQLAQIDMVLEQLFDIIQDVMPLFQLQSDVSSLQSFESYRNDLKDRLEPSLELIEKLLTKKFSENFGYDDYSYVDFALIAVYDLMKEFSLESLLESKNGLMKIIRSLVEIPQIADYITKNNLQEADT
ncbi:hypothetical protein SNEBB_000061 [Seison nebaliae]|nr:hypothetical protein SNEBB_000061 [Seison nebaliae]